MFVVVVLALSHRHTHPTDLVLPAPGAKTHPTDSILLLTTCPMESITGQGRGEESGITVVIYF